jgi:hypothetical protein
MRPTAEARPPRRPGHNRLAHEWSVRYCQSAQRSADRSVQRLKPRCRWTAPASGCTDRRCSGPPSARQRARTDAAPCLLDPPPRGRIRKAPAPLRSARAAGVAHPQTLSRGLCGSLTALEVSGCTAPAPGPLRSFLPPCKRLYCTAVGLLRQGEVLQAAVLADRGALYLHPADKYSRLTRRPSQEQKVL